MISIIGVLMLFGFQVQLNTIYLDHQKVTTDLEAELYRPSDFTV